MIEKNEGRKVPLAQKVDESENIDLNLDLVRKVKSATFKQSLHNFDRGDFS